MAGNTISSCFLVPLVLAAYWWNNTLNFAAWRPEDSFIMWERQCIVPIINYSPFTSLVLNVGVISHSLHNPPNKDPMAGWRFWYAETNWTCSAQGGQFTLSYDIEYMKYIFIIISDNLLSALDKSCDLNIRLMTFITSHLLVLFGVISVQFKY